MLRTSLICLLLPAACLLAQPPGGGRGRGFGPPREPGMEGPGPGGRMLAAEAGMPGRVVKNAPYSAEIVAESTQTLPDGNRIRQTNTVRVARDSEGRTRREQSLRNLGGLAPDSSLPNVVFINDPVAGVNYALNPSEKTASKSRAGARGRGGPGSDQPRPMMRQPGGPPPGGAQPNVAGPGRGRRGPNENLKIDSLGRQTVEGVPADGTRTTMTIPAAQIGNDQPIQIVTERWYSPDLQAEVLVKRTDPRTGESVTRMTNISRSEPPRTLFDVPADFKVSDSGDRPMMRNPRQ